MFLRGAEAPEGPPASAEDQCSGTAQIYFRMAAEESQLPREPIRVSNVVDVHSGQIATPRPVNALVQACREPEPAPITPANHARVIEAARDRQTKIVRAIVAEQELEVAVALVQERANGQLQGGRAVVKGHGDGDDGVSHWGP